VTPLKVRGSGRKLKFTSANFARENFPRRVCWAKSAPGGPRPVQKSREKKMVQPPLFSVAPDINGLHRHVKIFREAKVGTWKFSMRGLVLKVVGVQHTGKCCRTNKKDASGTPAQVHLVPGAAQADQTQAAAAGVRGNGCETASSQKYNCGKAAIGRWERGVRGVARQIRAGAESASGSSRQVPILPAQKHESGPKGRRGCRK